MGKKQREKAVSGDMEGEGRALLQKNASLGKKKVNYFSLLVVNSSKEKRRLSWRTQRDGRSPASR